MNKITLKVTLKTDKKGYLDRQCPNDKCGFVFKVNCDDWNSKIDNLPDSTVHCPLCGHTATSDEWNTDEQFKEMEERAKAYVLSIFKRKMDRTFRNLARTYSNGFIKITYNPGRRITFWNNPIGAREEWISDYICDQCGTRYAAIGSVYFCPCCGYNSIINTFIESLDTVEKQINTLREIKKKKKKNRDKDTAENIYRKIIENSMEDIVSAYQKFAAAHYEKLSGKKARLNDFQIVDKGSDFFKSIDGRGYEDWLSKSEMQEMRKFFQQRHLITHNNSMVDEQYIVKSGDISYTTGQRLVIKERDVLRLLEIIKKLAKGLMNIETGKKEVI